MSVPVCSQTYTDFHLMPRRTGNLTLFSCKYKFGGLSGLQCDKRRIYFTDCCLFCSKTPTDSWFLNTYPALWNAQCSGKDTTHMKYNLCRRDHMKPSISVKTGICAEGFHHCLVKRPHMICVFEHLITIRYYGIHITISVFFTCNQIPSGISSNFHRWKPVLLRVYKDSTILCLMKIKDRFEDIIFHFYQLHCF